MFKIKRLRVEILSNKSVDISDTFGFDYEFNDGLNIIAGHNSRGKTTINSCIYYGLGMEELLGSNNEKALDKSLKDSFVTNNDDLEEINHTILGSKVFLEIENKDEIVTLLRFIKSETHKNNTIIVFNSDINSLNSAEESVYYVNGRGNNDDDNGFYNWLSNFMNIEIPLVSNNSKKDNYSPLYLQVIFSALFVEQTKGWSDFFATMPFFGIPRAKEKNVEFLLNLNELELSTKKDVLAKQKTELSEVWKSTIKSLQLFEMQYNGSFNSLPVELTTEKSEIEKIDISFKISEDETISLKSNLEIKQNEFESLEKTPISKVEDNRQNILEDYQKQKAEYFELKEYIKEFESNLVIENTQYENIKKQNIKITQEIKDHDSLKKVFDEKILNKKGGNYCPTCSQSVSTDLISSQNIAISKLSLEENTAFLKGQRKLIGSSLSSLEKIIKEKKVLLKYFNENLRQKEILIKSLSRDLFADDRSFSEAEIVKKLQIEKEIEELKFIESQIKMIKENLIDLSNKYHNLKIAINGLKTSEDEDEQKIKDFEDLYKDLLFAFGYESNEKYKITINRKEPFKYFPVYNKYPNDTIPQSIRINSSASDFVRNIWAYSLSLLIKGQNHPGILIFDEPGQHRTNLQSLKSLFKASSVIKDKQVIIFTSTDKQINDKETIEIDKLTSDLEEESYKLIKLDEQNKVIQQLK